MMERQRTTSNDTNSVGSLSDEEIMDLIQHDEEGGNNNKNKIQTMIIKESSNKSSSTFWKMLALVFAVIIGLLATDSIEIKALNNGELKIGHLVNKTMTMTKQIQPQKEQQQQQQQQNPKDSINKETTQDDEKKPNETKNNPKQDVNEDTTMTDTDTTTTTTTDDDNDTSSSLSKQDVNEDTTMTDTDTTTTTDDDNDKSSSLSPSTTRYTYTRRGQPLSDEERTKMTEKWGQWSFVDTKKTERPKDDFYNAYTNRDIPRDEFPSNAWQLDSEYLSNFLKEGKDLVMRSMEAILAEYGHSIDDEPDLSFEERSKMFQLVQYDGQMTDIEFGMHPGNDQGGWTSKRSWDGLKRRLLHSIMTEDSFNFGMGGHSSAAGHGNHFTQSYTLQVAWIMEPIFARLGVKHQSRNFGNGGLGTLHNGIGAGSIYGPDLSLLLWDSGMTEKGTASSNTFARQGLLGGLKVPVIWNIAPEISSGLHDNADVDIGYMGSSMSGITQSKTQDDIDNTVWAAKYINCANEIKGDLCSPYGYNGTCWIDRSDYTPTKEQDKVPGGRASWHPGNRYHQLTGRSIAFTLLLALHEVLVEWSEAKDQILSDDTWHVTKYYDNIRTKVTTLEPSETAGCDEFEKHGFGFLCKVPFQARTEFTPRAYPALTNIRSLMPSEMLKNMPELPVAVYNPPDVFNPFLHPPKGEVDVLSIVENGLDYKDVMDPSYTDFYKSSSSSSDKSLLSQVPGTGYGFSAWKANGDYCDGTLNSWCSRGSHDKCLLAGHNDGRNGFLMDSYSGWMVLNLPKVKYGYIVIKVETWHPAGANERTEGWTSINNEVQRKLYVRKEGETRENKVENNSNNMMNMYTEERDNEMFENYYHHHHEQEGTITTTTTTTTSNTKRELKTVPPKYCDDFQFEYSIDGKVTSLDKDEFKEKCIEVQRVVELITLLEDPNYTNGKEEDVEIAFRITGCERDKTLLFTHIYWA